MCGIAGFWGYGGLKTDAVQDVALRMADTIRHRGPDDCGVWREDSAQLALVHRRLSIVDLSPAGHQPMASASDRYMIVFNGEIYNHLALRTELQNEGMAPNWRGHSDTESLLAAFEAWGIEKTLQRVIGMFALALWDRRERMLSLARDRLGEKPLYYGWQSGTLLFGSELKALKAHPAFKSEIDRDALALMMRHNYIPAPYSIYQGIKKLPPGTYIQLDATSCQEQVTPRAYWSLGDVVQSGLANPFAGDDVAAVNALDSVLRAAVNLQMVADVPLGAFLSGGIDSSTVVALMQAQSSRPVKTFSIGFSEEGYNEAEHAKAVARHLGTDHTELYVTSEQAMAVIPQLPTLYDEPFSDSSQIPTFLVSQMAKQHVTVSLSGDAGDELFGGYNRYVLSQALWNKISYLPAPARKGVARIINAIGPTAWNRMLEPLQGLMPNSLRQANIGDKLHKGAEVLSAGNNAELYRFMISHWTDPSQLILGGKEPPTVVSNSTLQPKTDTFVHQMMALDTLSYLPDDILCKVDRAAMGVSLETRIPFLDHRVVEFAWRLPLSLKLRNGQGKWLLRQVLYNYVPKELIDRPKMGFAVPIGSWLRGPLRDWAEELLDESRLRQEGYFNPGPIRQKWAEHLSGQRNWQTHLWNILMFQAWLQDSNR